MIDKEDIELKLLANELVSVSNIGLVVSPKVKDVIRLGYSKYNESLSALLFDKDKIQDLKDAEESNFILTCYFFHQDEQFRNSFKNGIDMMFSANVEMLEIEGSPILSLGEISFIDESNFAEFQDFIRIVNKAESNQDEEEFNAGNSRAQKMIDELKKGKGNKPQKKPVINFHSLISGLSWKSTSGINISNVFDLTIYQFYDGYRRLENIDHYNSVLTGIYTGNVDAKTINMQDINWVKIIQ